MTTDGTPAPDPLEAFVVAAKANHIPDVSLVALLRQNGWSEKRAYRSLTAYYGTSLGLVPPSRNGGGEYARDAFLYLVNFISLAFWATALGQLFYAFIARHVPDPAIGSTYADRYFVQEVSWQIATVVVAFPVFAFVHRIVELQVKNKPEAGESGVRLWLTYCALVVAAFVCMGDAIWFLESFIRGELTVRFVLDALVLAVIGGGIFAFYLSGLQRGRSIR